MPKTDPIRCDNGWFPKSLLTYLKACKRTKSEREDSEEAFRILIDDMKAEIGDRFLSTRRPGFEIIFLQNT